MHRPVHRAALLLLATLVACRGDTARTAVSDGNALRVDPATASGAITLELWQLRSGVTLGDWKASHPDEQVVGSDSSSVARYFGDWCAAAQRSSEVGGRVVVRTAFFYPPDPGNLALPDSVPDLVRQCVLGLIWVSAAERDSAVAERLADSVRYQLAGAFGPAQVRPVSFFGSAFWSRTTRYARDSTTVVTALRSGGRLRLPGDTVAAGRTVLAFALRAVSGVSLDSGATPRGPYVPGDTLPLDSAIALAGLDTAHGSALRAPVRAATRSSAGASAELIRPLTRWINAAAALPLARRAAALYAADLVLDRSLCSYQLCDLNDRASRAPLEGLGAAFNRSELGGSWVYERSWLNQARVLDRDSPLGRHILLIQMNNAFDFSGTCRGGAEGFRRVIENGERYLERVPRSPIAAEVHFLVAEGYRDIVALAHGAGDIYADSSQYGAEAGNAAAAALEHYRDAMRAGPSSATARVAWQRAWMLKAGLAPRDVRFYCVYD